MRPENNTGSKKLLVARILGGLVPLLPALWLLNGGYTIAGLLVLVIGEPMMMGIIGGNKENGGGADSP